MSNEMGYYRGKVDAEDMLDGNFEVDLPLGLDTCFARSTSGGSQ